MQASLLCLRILDTLALRALMAPQAPGRCLQDAATGQQPQLLPFEEAVQLMSNLAWQLHFRKASKGAMLRFLSASEMPTPGVEVAQLQGGEAACKDRTGKASILEVPEAAQDLLGHVIDVMEIIGLIDALIFKKTVKSTRMLG